MSPSCSRLVKLTGVLGLPLAVCLAPLRLADGGVVVARAQGAITPVRVKMTFPAAGTTLHWGEDYAVSWRNPDLGTRARETRIFLSLDNGVRWRQLAVLVGNPGTWDWSVHEVPGIKRNCLLRIDIRNARGRVIGTGKSRLPFTIIGTKSLYRMGGTESWYVRTMQMGKSAAGDLDGDGRQEVAALFPEGGSCSLVEVMRREADRTLPFVDTLSTLGLLDLKGVVAADLNGDGRTDLAFSAVSTLGSGMLARLLVLYQDPVTGEIGATDDQKVLSSDRIGDLVSGDFNGDGRTDVAVVTEPTFSGGLGVVSIFLQSPTGALLGEKRYAGCPVELGGAIGAGDVDGDGRTDLVVQSGPRELAVLLQDPLVPTTGFAAPLYVNVGTADTPAVSTFAVGDLNNDGAADLAVVAGASIRVFRRGFDGAFSEAVSIQLESEPRGVLVADYDGDRLNDILADWPTRLGIFRQTCNHTFRPQLSSDILCGTPADPNLPGSLLQADVDGDGIPDTVVSGYRGDLFFFFGAALP
jgi:hypothetical protein